MKKEYWKPVVGYEGLYEVSNLGRVKSYYFKGTIKIITPSINRGGYLQITLCKDKKKKNHLIHRLVAEAFLPNPLNLPQVNHKSENKLDNSVENLEWCDAKYNINYGTAIKRSAEKRSKTVFQYDLNGNFIKEWKSESDCRRNGFKGVSSCCLGKLKQHKGFIFKYKEDI